jgi:hypothetical protein
MTDGVATTATTARTHISSTVINNNKKTTVTTLNRRQIHMSAQQPPGRPGVASHHFPVGLQTPPSGASSRGTT